MDDKILIVLMYFLLLIIFFAIKKIINKDKGPIFNGVMFSILLYYIIIPILSVINIEKLKLHETSRGYWGTNTIVNHFMNENTLKYFFSIILILLVINIILIIYKQKNNNAIVINTEKLNKIVKFFTNFTFYIGMLSLIIFLFQFGGIKNALAYSEYLRSFANETTSFIGKFAILIIPARLITVTPFLAFYMIELNNKKYYKLIFIISVAFTFVFFLFNAGRAPIILFILPFLFVWLSKFTKHPWRLILIIGITMLPLLDILDSLFTFFIDGEFDIKQINYTSYLFQFFYPIRNVVNITNITKKYGMRYRNRFYNCYNWNDSRIKF